MPQARLLDVQAFLDTHPFSGFQWRVFALCFCVILLDGFDTAAIGYIAPSLMAEWGVGRADLAPVLSAALFGLAFVRWRPGRWPTASAASGCWSARSGSSAPPAWPRPSPAASARWWLGASPPGSGSAPPCPMR